MMTVHAQLPSPARAVATGSQAIVIGAGFGGLAAALRLGARGYNVTVLERRRQPGGRARVFRQDGFTFDAGPTIITLPFLFEELWALAGRRMADDVTLKALDPCYSVRFSDGESFRCFIDDDAMRAEVARINPSDVPGFVKLMEESKACFETGFEGMVDQPFLSLKNMAQALPDLIRRRADRSVYALVAKHVGDLRLRMALSFHPLFIGGNPMRTSAILSLISYLERRWGVHYVMGGTGALVRGLVDLIAGQGGAVRLNSDVAEIVVENGAAAGVRLADGEVLPADIVVSNADTAWTYEKLLPAECRKRWTDRKLARAAYSMSLFVWYFGTRRRYPSIDHHTVLMGPRYHGLLADIFDRKVLAEDFSLYLHRPTATDPNVAPEGCDAFYVLSPVPNLDAGIDWQTAAEPYRRKIAAYLEATLLPDLKNQIITSRIMTPVDFRDELNAVKGAAFGLEPRLTQIAWFRPHNRSEDVKNLYIVGAGTHPGAGVPGVVSSARILDRIVPHGLLAA